MSSRYSAARPKRAGEAFARTHHGERDEDDFEAGSSKKVKFDVRNPSALAPDAREEDDVLDADVIGVGSGAATKRGAVNIDGYDSDSENETFNARADARQGKGKKKGDDGVDVNIAEQLDNYDRNLKNGGPPAAADKDDDDDMFAEPDADEAENGDPAAPETTSRTSKKDKEVRFLDNAKIEGQEEASKSGGHIRLDEESSDEDEEEIELAIQEEGVDEEVGAGGLKKHAPRIDAFNMKEEQEEGAFDESGNYIRKAADPDAVHDRWLEGVSKKDMKKAAAAHEKREAELRQQRKEDDSIMTSDLLKALITRLDKGETALEALARLAKNQTKPKKIPKWKLKKQKHGADGEDGMDVDKEREPENPEQVRIKDAINDITDAADKLLGRDYPNVYHTEREMLIREYRNETGEAWVEPAAQEEEETDVLQHKMWEYRWTDGRDGGARQGPYDGPTMKAWQDAGYFSEGIEFRPVGDEATWTRVATFM